MSAQLRFKILLSTLIFTGLSGCGASSSTGTAMGGKSTSATGSGSSAIESSGASVDNPQDAWVLGENELATTRDGGVHWTRSPAPVPAATVDDVAVLTAQTVVLSGSGNDLNIYSIAGGSGSWQDQTVTLSVPIGQARVVETKGVLLGIMVTQETNSNFSRGVWLSTPDAGISWQQNQAPVGGTVTEAGGALWLVGGVQNGSLFESRDNGTTWQSVYLPNVLTADQTAALGEVYSNSSGSGVLLTSTTPIQSADEIQIGILTGTATGTGWSWGTGPSVRLSANYGTGVAATSSLAAGVLWIATNTQLARFTLSTNSVSVIAPDGFPNATEESFTAEGPNRAWASYSLTSCMKTKSDCNPITGLVSTTDGGQVWAPSSNPLT